jgi:hypothetical protein
MKQKSQAAASPPTRTALAIYDDGFAKLASARWLYHKVIDGVPTGVLIATFNPSFGNYSINRAELVRLLDALNSGKLHEAYVQAVLRYDQDARKYMYGETVEAREMWAKLERIPVRSGSLGEFWAVSNLSGEDRF